MRTLEFVPPTARRRIAEETLDIYAPLAGRMGMQEMREELEDLSFRTLDPEAYAVVMQRLDSLADRNRNLIGEIESQLSRNLQNNGMAAHVYGRRKQPFSIWTKMERKSVGFEQLSDIFGFRVVMDDVEACYRALGVVHTTWPVVPGRFKDYISTPKQNDYRSIHTTVIGPGSQRVELQIRTHEMHEVAEYGIAAHAIYKDAGTSADAPVVSESRAYRGLRQTIEALASDDSEKFLEHTKLELFHDQVFCFTPKGRLIALPRGATAIGGRGEDQRPHRAADLGASQRRRGADLARRGGVAAGGLGQRRGDRARSRRHPPRDARGGEGPVRRPRAPDRRARV
jgi:GTP pyrophosphokinase/guanosine-3',5'-bis(diphosphate) 3'-pyrophosphohydrolase